LYLVYPFPAFPFPYKPGWHIDKFQNKISNDINQGVAIGGAMSNPDAPDIENRSLEQALTNKIIDDYFDSSESWLRAILRMCFFSLAHLDGLPVFVVECPNQAVAKRLSRKIYPFRGILYYLTDDFSAGSRSLFCYRDAKLGAWYCYDTSTNSWTAVRNLEAPTDE
jgi:hypothetical protein